ncbi:MAG: A/G-specific adenine glycosylase [Bacteroidia bacterium]
MSQQNLLIWYHKNKRELPWRSTQNPYFIWLSEVILQQTRVEQGLNYFLKFVEEFPSVDKLASASQDQILKLWQGLGYYSRARNMHQTAQLLVENYNGNFPQTSIELQKLKGIGPYTAAAIASFAFHEPVAVLDGNVFRVLSRIFNEPTPINSNHGKKLFSALANEFLNTHDPSTHNQAMMELGALVCKPQNPDCENCPLQSICLAYQHKTQKSLPVKEKKLKVKERYMYYMYVLYQQKLLLRKRGTGDIWEGLFDLPCFESESPLTTELILNEFSKFFPSTVKVQRKFALKHQLTHRTLFAEFFQIDLEAEIMPFQDSFWVELDMLKSFPASRMFEKFQQSLILQDS